jgi:uncharacterized membrane-anchored protein
MQKCAAVVIVAWALSFGVAQAQDSLPAGWTGGPVVGKLGTRATVAVPDGYYFLDKAATARFLEENENIPSGNELGTILKISSDGEDYWFAVFTYSGDGYIDDSDRDKLDASVLMKSLQEGNKRGNAERQRRGWSPLILEGWHQPPFYDLATNNLTWATKLSADGAPVINHSVRLLGRTGLMSAQLVADVPTIAATTAEFNSLLRSYSFNPGQRYAEFRPGDKLAGYGLTALIAGGAGAAAVKSGLLQKFWKLIVFALVGLMAGLKKLLAAFGNSREQPSES